MHLFVTGASGRPGSAIANDLTAASHQLLGLTRHS
jgi:nucleoside-diphosphate-sugar epimerase